MARPDAAVVAARMAHVNRIVVVGALPESLVNFRGALLRACVAAGVEVIALADNPNAVVSAQLQAMGVRYEWYPVERNGRSPMSDLRTYVHLRRLFKEIRPTVVLAYTIKPVVWSGLALRGIPNVRYCAMITGLGYAFQGRSVARRWLTTLVSVLYRSALRRADVVVFQNSDNRRTFVDRRLVTESRTAVVRGSGVDLTHFQMVPLPDGPPVVLLIARLLGDKGLREYAAAARRIRTTRPDVRFQLLGPADPSPDGIPAAELQQWSDDGVLEYLGSTDDVRPFLAACHLFVLPSYHEGMPRTVLEALAVGRPVVTTSVPGCADTVQDGVNGRVVPARNATALADAIEELLDQHPRWPLMAEASRALASSAFDVRLVNTEMCHHLGVSP
jgi:glycosyltransferase involved in cell wall biosynthesis